MPVNAVFGTLQIALTARILGPTGFGLIALFTASSALLSAIITTQNGTTILTFLNRSPEHNTLAEGSRIIRFSYLADIVTATAAFVLLSALAAIAPGVLKIAPNTAVLFVSFSLTIILSSTYWDSQSVLRVLNRTDVTFRIALIQSVIKTALMGAAYLWFRSIQSYIIVVLIAAAFGSISLFVVSQRLLAMRGVHRTDRLPWWRIPPEIRSYSFQGYGIKILKTVSRYADTVFLGFFTGVLQTGRYRASRQLTDTIQVPLQGFITSLYSEYSRLYFAGEIKTLRKLLIRSTIVSGVLGIMGSFLLLVFMDLLIRLVLGTAFMSIKPVLSVLFLFPVISLVFAPITILPSMTGNQKPVLFSLVISLLVQGSLLPILVPRIGAVGAAWTILISTTMSMLVFVMPVFRILSKRAENGMNRIGINDH